MRKVLFKLPTEDSEISENKNAEERITPSSDKEYSAENSNERQSHSPNEEENATEHRLRSLYNSAEGLVNSNNWEPAKKQFDQIIEELNNFDRNEDKEQFIDKIKEYYETFNKNYEQHKKVKQNIKSAEKLIDELEYSLKNESSEKLSNIFDEKKKAWKELSENIPDRFLEILEKRFNSVEEQIQEKLKDLKAKEKSQSDLQKEAKKIYEKAKEIFDSDNWHKNIEKFDKLVEKWNNLIKDAEGLESYIEKFNQIRDEFNEKKEKYLNEVAEKNKENEQRLEELLNQLKEYCEAENVKKVLYSVKDIQEEWKNIENCPAKQRLSKQFNKLINKYFSRLKFIQQKEDWQRWENYTNKVLLCERAEALQDETDMFKVSKELKNLWNEWKKLGQAPREYNEDIWKRFNDARRPLRKNCNDFFAKLKEAKKENLTKKEELCNRAVELQDSTDWEDTAEELKRLQKEWKEIGPAPKSKDDQLFENFRNACNNFFQRRIEFYSELHKKQAKNKKKKREICDEAAELTSFDSKEGLKKIKELRQKWKQIGSANKKDEQTLWKRFNEYIDKFMEKLEEERPENLRKKTELCDKVSSILSDEENEYSLQQIKDEINNFENNWREIGPVPKEQEDEIKERYEKLRNELYKSYRKKQNEEAIKHRNNILEKEKLIAKVENIIKSSDDWDRDQEKVKSIQEEWNNLELPIDEKENNKLNERFENTCNAFFNKDLGYFDEITEEKLDNLKAKKQICVELEQLAGVDNTQNLLEENDKNSLAEELKLAIESNFASEEPKKADIYKKYQQLKKRWDSIGPVPFNEYEHISERYDKICNYIETNFGE